MGWECWGDGGHLANGQGLLLPKVFGERPRDDCESVWPGLTYFWPLGLVLLKWAPRDVALSLGLKQMWGGGNRQGRWGQQ